MVSSVMIFFLSPDKIQLSQYNPPTVECPWLGDIRMQLNWGWVLDSLIPRPSAHAKRVWCSERHFLLQGAGPISDLRSPIRLQKI